jgi:hypothetical protein
MGTTIEKTNLKYIEAKGQADRENLSVEQFFFNWLYENGLIENEANQVVDIWKPKMEDADISMHERWNDPISNYSHTKTIWLMWLKDTALEWLEIQADQRKTQTNHLQSRPQPDSQSVAEKE